MAKRIWAIQLIVLLLLQIGMYHVEAAQSDITPMGKVSAIETSVFGIEQTGALVERVQRLEKELFGIIGKEALVSKVDKIYNYTLETTIKSPSLLLKLNALEWVLNKSVTNAAAKSKLENLEKAVVGINGTGPIDTRLNRLVAMIAPKGKVDISQATLVKDTLLKIKMTSPLDSKTSKVGDPVTFEAAEDVYASNVLLLSKGAVGKGRVTKVESAQNFGRDAKMEVSFDTVQAVDMTVVATVLGEKAKQETQSMAKAAGAAMVGLILLGPIGVVGSAFVHGKNITVPTGTLLYIQSKEDTELFGVTTQ